MNGASSAELLAEVARLTALLAEREEQHRRERARQTELLRALSAALFRVEESERRELATLLHDVVGQHLVAARLHLDGLPPAIATQDGLERARELLDQAQQAIRSLTFQLRPPILQDLGLVAALRWLARETSGQFGLAVEVEAEEPAPRLVGDPEYLLFRCVRELLLNVVKHATATVARVEVGVDDSGDLLVLRVDDDGRGFDPEQALGERMTSRSFGLLSVQERVAALGGRVTIESSPGRGTHIELRVPIGGS